MFQAAPDPVLRCGLCNKPFDKQSSLKRHGYYCRSRKIGSTVRPRSCIACAKGKARCDNTLPECTRCLAKAIECRYPANTRKSRTTPSTSTSPSSVETLINESNLLESNPSELISSTTFDPAYPVHDVDVDNFNWGEPQANYSGLWNPTLEMEDLEGFVSTPCVSIIRRPSPSPNLEPQILDVINPALLNFSIPPVPTTTTHDLVMRSRVRSGSYRAVTLMMHTLKSYPLMILRDNVLPPFIHPHVVSPDFGNKDMETLNNCISLMRMIGPNVQDNRKLFWKNVRFECERLIAEAPELNNWQLLAGMASLSIYILLRVGEGETEHNKFDKLVLTTITAIAKYLVISDLSYVPAGHTYDPIAQWKDWLYMESRRRIGIIFRVINMILYFDPGAMCSLQSDLILAPLPAKKQLWEALDAATWKVEREKMAHPRRSFGLASNGDLVTLDEMDLQGGYGEMNWEVAEKGDSEKNWEEFCAGVDSFGGLIMLAAALVG